MAADNLEFYEGMALEIKAKSIILNGCRDYSNTFKLQEREFRIIKYSFTRPYVHWEIFKSEGSFYLCRLKWYFETDWDKFQSPSERLKYPKNIEPTITYNCRILDNKLYEEFRDKLVASDVLNSDCDIIENDDSIVYDLFLGEDINCIAKIQYFDKKSDRQLNYFESFLSLVEDVTER